MIVVNDRKKEPGSQQNKTEIFYCFTYFSSTESHFYTKPSNL